MVVACSVVLSNNTIKVSCQYNVGCVVPEVVRNGVIEESFSLCSVIRATVSITVTQRCVLDSERGQTSVKAFFDV